MEGAIYKCEHFYTRGIYEARDNVTNTYVTACINDVKAKVKGNDASLLKVQKVVDDFQVSIMDQLAAETDQQYANIVNSSAGDTDLQPSIEHILCTEATQKMTESLSGLAFEHLKEVQDGCNKSNTCEVAAVTDIDAATTNLTNVYAKKCMSEAEENKKAGGQKYVLIKHVLKWMDTPKDKLKAAMRKDFHIAIHEAMEKAGLTTDDIKERTKFS